MDLGVSLPIIGGRTGTANLDLPGLARHAEDVGLDTVWVGDHLATGVPLLDSTVVLGAAAAATERIKLGYGVLLLALRQPAVMAKQLATLQRLSHGRVVLGVGVGGQWPDEWAAAGIPLAGRGARTDAILRQLPGLLSGEPTVLDTEPGSPTVTLTPAVDVPPVWVGGMSDRALRRAVEHGTGWLASMITPDELARSAARLAELAEQHGRATPEVGTLVFCSLEDEADGDRLARHLTATYGLDPERAASLVVAGSPDRVADRIAEYVEAGASTIECATFGADVRRQYELVGQLRR